MKVFKFGGASVKDASSVANVMKVLDSQNFENCLVVVSAMGKTTNALETVVELYFKKEDYKSEIQKIKKSHLEIAEALFEEGHSVFGEIAQFFDDVKAFLSFTKSPNYNFVYDQVVSSGELISSIILSRYLNEKKYTNQWLDVRDYIKTDSTYREGVVDWKRTEEFMATLNKNMCYVTQGFIGSDENYFTVTLGREGSDYSAAIFAYCLNAESMTIWKDVPGVMTGDPRKFSDVKLLSHISYEEAIEMAYYGASVIHPKTLQPLKQKHIPFFVRSFIEPTMPGTQIGVSDKNQNEESYILKENQILMRISSKDFSFIAEEHLKVIFDALAKNKIKISLMQNSAISLALCLEDKYHHLQQLVESLESDFNIETSEHLSLFTVRNLKKENVEKHYEGKKVLLEQLSKNTLQMITN